MPAFCKNSQRKEDQFAKAIRDLPDAKSPEHLPRTAEDDGATYIALKSRLFDDRWIVLKRVVVADMDEEYTAKAIAKELNEALND